MKLQNQIYYPVDIQFKIKKEKLKNEIKEVKNKLLKEQQDNPNSPEAKKLNISYKTLLREFREMKEQKQKADDMFLEVAQNLRKGIKDIVKGNKFIDF